MGSALRNLEHILYGSFQTEENATQMEYQSVEDEDTLRTPPLESQGLKIHTSRCQTISDKVRPAILGFFHSRSRLSQETNDQLTTQVPKALSQYDGNDKPYSPLLQDEIFTEVSPAPILKSKTWASSASPDSIPLQQHALPSRTIEPLLSACLDHKSDGGFEGNFESRIGPRISSVRKQSPNVETPLKIPLHPSVTPLIQFNGLSVIEPEPMAETESVIPEPGRHFSVMFGLSSRHTSVDISPSKPNETTIIDLTRKEHVDIYNKPEGFNVHDTCHHAPIARNWPVFRKRFVATGACINTSCIGLILGIYAGEVPAVQYMIADFSHFSILGNVVLYLGLAITTFTLWPLPLLHGRKPYTTVSILLVLVLQVPQAVAVSTFRDPTTALYRTLLLTSRACSGIVLGLLDMNINATLLDLYGASLQSRHPHQELPDTYDVRRHGGGIGLWLGIWSWTSMASISLGFTIGAFIINTSPVVWGFWMTMIVIVVQFLINAVIPEVRRSAFRRTIAELIGQVGSFSRITRGEIKMHLRGTGPYWWGEEVIAGLQICWKMIKQPGFFILSFYTAWVYAQFTLILMLLGASASKHYRYTPVYVGLCALSPALGALLAVPFQKASWLSRARTLPPRTDSMTMKSHFEWSSHLIRRTLFTIFLPIASAGFAASFVGPPIPIAIPCLMAGFVGFFSILATAECYGIIMETFDVSDLQPGMTGRPIRRSVAHVQAPQRTNFTCHPRVSAGIATIQAMKYCLGAASTGLCGRVERRIGSTQANAVVAGIHFGLTILLTIVLLRWKRVQMIPTTPYQDQWRRRGTAWEPIILGRPSGLTRKISILEAGRQTRWSEIRQRNRLMERDSLLTGEWR